MEKQVKSEKYEKILFVKSEGCSLTFTMHFPDGVPLMQSPQEQTPSPPLPHRMSRILLHAQWRLSLPTPTAFMLCNPRLLFQHSTYKVSFSLPQSSWPKPSAHSDDCQHTGRPGSCQPPLKPPLRQEHRVHSSGSYLTTRTLIKI